MTKTKDKAKQERFIKLGLSLASVIFLVLSLFLFAQNSGLSSDVTELSGKVASLEEDKSSLQDEKAMLQKSLDTLEARVGELEKDVVGYRDENEELQKELEDLKIAKEAAETKLTEIEAEIAGPIGYVFEAEFGSSLSQKIDDGEYNKLFDGDIKFNDDKYDVHEEILFNGDVKLETSGLNGDKEFGAEPYVVILDKGAIMYRYVFDDVIDMTEISEDEPLSVDMMGKSFEIIGMDDNSMTVRFGQKYTLQEGESVGNLMFLDASVKGDTAIFKADNKLIYAKVDDNVGLPDGKELIVKEVIPVHSGDSNTDVVIFYLGDGLEVEYDNAEEIMEDPNWELYWNTNGDDLEFFEIRYMEKGNELDDDYPPLGIGDKIEFPLGDYMFVFDGYENKFERVDIELSFDEEDADDDLLTDTSGVWLKSGKSIFLVDDEEVDEVFLVRLISSWEIYYKDDDNYFKQATSGLKIEYEDTEFDVVLETSGNKDIVIDDGFCELRFDVRPSDEKLGDVQEEAEPTEIKYCGVSIGEREEDVLTGYGIIIESPESNGDNDEIMFSIPSDQLVASLRVV